MLRHLIFFTVALPFALQAQPFQWAAPIFGAPARGMAMVTDGMGNVYVCGNVNGVSDFDPGPDTVVNVSAGINGDHYLVKYGPSGNYMWHIAVGGSGTEIPKGLALDHAGNLIMVGRFDSYFDWDPGEGDTSFGSAGSTDGFVAKYDTSGHFIWAQRIGGTGHDEAYGVAVDDNNNAYVTGWMSGNVDFDNGPNTLSLINQGGTWDAYCVKYDAGGAVQWVRGIQGAGSQRGMSAAYLGGHVYCYGVFSSETNVDGIATVTSNGQGDDYICKLDTAGAVAWVRNLGGPENEQAEAIRTDGTFLYVTGSFAGTIDADPGPNVLPLTTTASRSVHYTKLDSAGNALWSHQVQGNNHFDGVCDIAVDNEGNVFLTGAYYAEQDFDDGDGEFILAPVVANDLYLMKVDADGHFVWALSIATGGVFDTANGLVTDANGNIFVTGGYGESAVFDPDAPNGTFPGGSSMTGFTAKYGVDLTTRLPVMSSTSDFAFLLFPNPSEEQLNITLGNNVMPDRLVITDANGRVAMHWEGRVPPRFGVAHLAPGTYYASVVVGDRSATVPFVVER